MYKDNETYSQKNKKNCINILEKLYTVQPYLQSIS